VIARIFRKDPRRAYIAYKYFLDMKDNLKEVHRVLKKDRHYVIVVGNNKIQKLKNSYELLRRCKESEFVLSECKKLGLI